jgi:hypothetical protein
LGVAVIESPYFRRHLWQWPAYNGYTGQEPEAGAINQAQWLTTRHIATLTANANEIAIYDMSSFFASPLGTAPVTSSSAAPAPMLMHRINTGSHREMYLLPTSLHYIQRRVRAITSSLLSVRVNDGFTPQLIALILTYYFD